MCKSRTYRQLGAVCMCGRSSIIAAFYCSAFYCSANDLSVRTPVLIIIVPSERESS